MREKLSIFLYFQGTPVVVTCLQLHRRAERVATLILEKGKRNVGDHVALVYPPSIDLVAAFYGCLYVGCVPIIIRPPHPHNLATTLPTLKMIVEASNSTCILTNTAIIKSLKSKVSNIAVKVLDVYTTILILQLRPKMFKPCVV